MMVNKRTMPARDNHTTGCTTSSSAAGTMGSTSGPGKGGKALIHPQRHNLKNRFEVVKTLGEGTYGKVKLACEKATGEKVAIKYVKKTKIQDETDLNRIRREIRILTSLRHPHIVNIRQVFEKKDRIVLVMDYAEGGELYDYLNSQRCLPEPETRRVFRQILAALHYVHQNGIVHRDLKLENIILDSQGNVKIADFGLANYYSQGSALNTYCGSPLYASPEIVNGKPYQGPEVDVWSLGVVLYTLAYGAMPFESGHLKVLKQQITTGQYAEPASPCGASGLIRHMLTVNPARRATLPEVLNHWWVNLGCDLTPDGRHHDLVSLALGRSGSRQHGSSGSSSAQGVGAEADSGSSVPSASLHRVPGARAGKKSAETSILEDGRVVEAQTTTTTATTFVSSPSSPSVAAASLGGDADARPGGIPACHSSQPVGKQENGGLFSGRTETCSSERTTDGTSQQHWSDILANSIREIRDRVIQSLASEGAAPQPPEEEGSDSGAPQLSDTVDEGSASDDVEEDKAPENRGPPGSADSDKAPTVFDSDRKPKRGILKRKGKFSGDDNGCCVAVDDRGVRPECVECLECCVNTKQRPDSLPLGGTSFNQPGLAESPAKSMMMSHAKPAIVSSLPSPASTQATQKAPNPVADCHNNVALTPTMPKNGDVIRNSDPVHVPCAEAQLLHSDLSPISFTTKEDKNVAGGSSPAPTSVDPSTGVNSETSKVVRRRKGILKNAGSASSGSRTSLMEDARKRLSMGSQSSNSSADILDLSYDSGDGDQLLCRSRSMEGQDMLCRSRSSENNQDTALLLSGLHSGISKSRSTDDEGLLCKSRSTDNQVVIGLSRCEDSRSASDASNDALDNVETTQPADRENGVGECQSSGENFVRRFHPEDLQQALSDFSMSCSVKRRPGYRYPYDPAERGGFSLEGELTALRLADMSGTMMPTTASPLCDDALFDYSEARHVLQQALQFAN